MQRKKDSAVGGMNTVWRVYYIVYHVRQLERKV
jgi:hypothetical protein